MLGVIALSTPAMIALSMLGVIALSRRFVIALSMLKSRPLCWIL